MITLHLTDQEAYNFRATLRNAVGGSRSRITSEYLQDLADRIQEQQQLALGGWFEIPEKGHFSSRVLASEALPELQDLCPTCHFKIARSVVWPGEWTFWTQGRQETL